MINGTIERDEQEVTCILDNGYKLRFFELGLREHEYIQRTNIIMCNERKEKSEHDKKLAHDIAMVLTSKLNNFEPLPLDLAEWYNKAVERLKEGEKG